MTATASGTVLRARVFGSSYRDSVELMRIASELERLPGITRAGLVMGTPANRAVLQDAGLLSAVPDTAGANDLIAAVAGSDPESAEAALVRAAALLTTLELGQVTLLYISTYTASPLARLLEVYEGPFTPFTGLLLTYH